MRAFVFMRDSETTEYIVNEHESMLRVIDEQRDERDTARVSVPAGAYSISESEWEERYGRRPGISDATEYLAQRSISIEGDPEGCWFWDRSTPVPWGAVWAGLHEGEAIPDGYFVGVSCSNKKSCCNPSHLQLVRRGR